MRDYIQIGTIVATHGWKGEVILVHELGKPFTCKDAPALFIEKNKQNFIPYFIESVQEKKYGEALLKLEGVNSKENARALLRKKVYLEQEHFHAIVQPGSHLYYLGFTLFDKKEKRLGEIEEITQLPGQLIAHVNENGNELLIPLTEQTIDTIDRQKKIIYVTLPEGLTGIYREENPDAE